MTCTLCRRQAAFYLTLQRERISIVHRTLNNTTGKPFNWPDKAAIHHQAAKEWKKRSTTEESGRMTGGKRKRKTQIKGDRINKGNDFFKLLSKHFILYFYLILKENTLCLVLA